MKRTPILRKTALRAKGCLSRLVAPKEPRQTVTVAFGDDGRVLSVFSSSLRAKPKPRPTKVQVARWDAMRARGCVACHLNGVDHGLARTSYGADLEIHHLLSGGRRRGHDFTVCLCHYHHQAKRLPYPEAGYQWHATRFGPSLERESRRFHEFYGTDDQLLAYQGLMLEGAETFAPAVGS